VGEGGRHDDRDQVEVRLRERVSANVYVNEGMNARTDEAPYLVVFHELGANAADLDRDRSRTTFQEVLMDPEQHHTLRGAVRESGDIGDQVANSSGCLKLIRLALEVEPVGLGGADDDLKVPPSEGLEEVGE